MEPRARAVVRAPLGHAPDRAGAPRDVRAPRALPRPDPGPARRAAALLHQPAPRAGAAAHELVLLCARLHLQPAPLVQLDEEERHTVARGAGYRHLGARDRGRVVQGRLASEERRALQRRHQLVLGRPGRVRAALPGRRDGRDGRRRLPVRHLARVRAGAADRAAARARARQPARRVPVGGRARAAVRLAAAAAAAAARLLWADGRRLLGDPARRARGRVGERPCAAVGRDAPPHARRPLAQGRVPAVRRRQ